MAKKVSKRDQDEKEEKEKKDRRSGEDWVGTRRSFALRVQRSATVPAIKALQHYILGVQN